MKKIPKTLRSFFRQWVQITAYLQAILLEEQSQSDMNHLCVTAVSLPAPFPVCMLRV